jgi:hypothetical protein
LDLGLQVYIPVIHILKQEKNIMATSDDTNSSAMASQVQPIASKAHTHGLGVNQAAAADSDSKADAKARAQADAKLVREAALMREREHKVWILFFIL